ncbi:hypothetical protein [Hyphomonas sp.]|jgi:hypothetical protein|uniref:hypothetical protein n=1 Tax=Hyphomonas sp. TaxID=87 RepID=UPI0039E5D1E1
MDSLRVHGDAQAAVHGGTGEHVVLKYLQFMTQTDVPRILYLVKAFAAAVLGTILVATLTSLLMPESAVPDARDRTGPAMIGVLVIWPILSTLVIWALLARLRRITPTYWQAAGASALVFLVLFSIGAGLQSGLIFAWPYFLYSLTFLAWQPKSDADAFIMTGLLQSAAMALPALIISS